MHVFDAQPRFKLKWFPILAHIYIKKTECLSTCRNVQYEEHANKKFKTNCINEARHMARVRKAAKNKTKQKKNGKIMTSYRASLHQTGSNLLCYSRMEFFLLPGIPPKTQPGAH